MRIAYCVRAVFPQHGYGGLERSATGLLRHLLFQGIDAALFTRELPPGLPFAAPEGSSGRLTVHSARYGRLPLKPNGIPARVTNYRRFVEDIGRKVEGLARSGHVDAVYAHGLCAWGVRRASDWGVPLVVNPHGMEEFKNPEPLKRLAYAPFRAWMRTACRAADRVVATDAVMRGEVVELLRVPETKVAVLPNGIDLDEEERLAAAAPLDDLIARWPHLGANHGTIRGITVGRLEANKAVDRLLRALARCSTSIGSEWSWTVVGEGSLRDELQTLAESLAISDRVHFVGSVSDEALRGLYRVSNLFAHPTLYEGSSLVTLEAMAHGLPVVASATGGIPDKVLEGETGFLIPPGDSRALAEWITWMAAHPLERATMGEHGRRLVRERFSWATIAGQTAALLGELAERAATCRGPEVVAN